MSIFSRIKGIFRRKEKPEIPSEEIGVEMIKPGPEVARIQKITMDNLNARLDLIMTELDSIKTQNRTINERLKAMEKILTEMRGIKYY